jgi:hypothetical protein
MTSTPLRWCLAHLIWLPNRPMYEIDSLNFGAGYRPGLSRNSCHGVYFCLHLTRELLSSIPY